jgi:hypothetical protein
MFMIDNRAGKAKKSVPPFFEGPPRAGFCFFWSLHLPNIELALYQYYFDAIACVICDFLIPTTGWKPARAAACKKIAERQDRVCRITTHTCPKTAKQFHIVRRSLDVRAFKDDSRLKFVLRGTNNSQTR